MAITTKTIEKDALPSDSLEVQFESQYKSIFPYGSVLSFDLLIEHWKQLQDSENLSESILAKELLDRLDNAPELIGDIEDHAIVENNQDLVGLLISGLFPALRNEQYMGIVAYPFAYNYVYKSEAVKHVMEAKYAQATFGESIEQMQRQKIINAGICILNEFYGQDIENEMVMMFSITAEDTGLITYYKGKVDTSYVQIRAKGPIKKLTPEQIQRLTSNIENVDYWLECLPPNNFEFVGVVQVKLTNITEEQSFNNLKLSLLQKNAVVDLDKLKGIELQMRNYLNLPDLRLGIAGKGYGAGDEFGIISGLWNSLLPMKPEYFEQTDDKALYKRTVESGRVTIIDDLRTISDPALYIQDLLDQGIKSLVIAPLLDDESGGFVGILELGSYETLSFHGVKAAKLKEILPSFTVALHRAIEEKGNDVEVLIKQKYTSIHPSVEWRFIQAANELINRRQLNPGYDTLEPISFKDVYPLYGQSDIVGSSSKRNAAIQKDLITNLELLKKTLEPIEICDGFPLVGVYQHRTSEFIKSLKANVNSGDEVRVTEYLTEEIEPLLENLSKHSEGFEAAFKAYKDELDPEMKVVYTHRRAYENSVTFLNETLSRLINEHQVNAQRVLPHYFEMYKTDGVEYNLYMGESMLYGHEFDEKYIQNIRLWQLLMMIAVTRKVAEVQPQLELPLKTAELILAFSNRIAIRFKTEEKQFDVDGAYNVRYEVIKKRIDKSKIKGTNERLTQAGKIAIVYTQEKERLEYLQFCEYLKAKGMIEDEVEELLIDELQGVSGLRALRVKVIV